MLDRRTRKIFGGDKMRCRESAVCVVSGVLLVLLIGITQAASAEGPNLLVEHNSTAAGWKAWQTGLFPDPPHQ